MSKSPTTLGSKRKYELSAEVQTSHSTVLPAIFGVPFRPYSTTAHLSSSSGSPSAPVKSSLSQHCEIELLDERELLDDRDELELL